MIPTETENSASRIAVKTLKGHGETAIAIFFTNTRRKSHGMTPMSLGDPDSHSWTMRPELLSSSSLKLTIVMLPFTPTADRDVPTKNRKHVLQYRGRVCRTEKNEHRDRKD